MRTLLAILLLCLPIHLFGAKGAVSGNCEKGSGRITIAGMQSTDYVQSSYPSCTITVYVQGTVTLATIFSDSLGTSKSNPFTAAADGSWIFWANDGNWDVQLSGTGIATAFTRTYNVGGAMASSVTQTPTGLGIPQALSSGLISPSWYSYFGSASITYSTAINDGACLANAATIPVTNPVLSLNAPVGRDAIVGANPALATGVNVKGKVTSGGVVTIEVCNWSGAAVTPGATTYYAQVLN